MDAHHRGLPMLGFVAGVWVTLLSLSAAVALAYGQIAVFLICIILAWSVGYRLMEDQNGSKKN